MWFQIFSIAFQVAGAIILLLWSLKGAKRDNIVKKYFPGSNFAKRDDANNCVLDKERLRIVAKEIYINIIAFFDLILGYGLSFYAVSSENKTIAMIITILITVILLAVEYAIARLISIINYKENITVNYDKLEINGVETFATKMDIYELFQ